VYFSSNIARNLTHLSAVEEVSIGLSNILNDMTQLSAVEIVRISSGGSRI